MLKSEIKIFDGKPLVLSIVSDFSSRTIKTVIVLNNTPYFLYVGRTQDTNRESCLFVVEPYTNVTMPLNVTQNLYVTEGPSIGTIPANLQATILYGEDLFPMAFVRNSRNVVIPLYSGKTKGATSTSLTAQGFGLFGGADNQPKPFAVPASALRRTIYVSTEDGQTLSGVDLIGSVDGVTWFTVISMTVNKQSATMQLSPDLALPPYLKLSITPSDTAAAHQINAYMVVDL